MKSEYSGIIDDRVFNLNDIIWWGDSGSHKRYRIWKNISNRLLSINLDVFNDRELF